MQRWEYLTIDIEQDENLTDVIIKSHKTYTGDEIWSYLNDEIGHQGWELVKVSTRDYRSKQLQRLWFKRLVADDSKPDNIDLRHTPPEIQVGP
jgi:hypothetical protein